MSQQGRLKDAAPSSFETLTGNTGGAVGPNGAGNINLVGSSPYTVSGNPGIFTLTISDDGTLATTYSGDSGSATPSGNNLNILGDATQGSITSAAGSTVTITNDDATTTQKGVLETSTDAESITGSSSIVSVVPSSLSAKLGTQTSNAIPYGGGTSAALNWTTAPTDGQLIIGSTAGAPAPANITSSGSTITITTGSNTLNIDTAGNIASSFPTDSGTATPAAGALTVSGGTLINTAGAASTVTINADDSVAASVATDSGTATPSSNSFSIVGSGTVSTTASGSTVTITGSGELAWNVETGTSATLAANNGYIGNNASGVSFTLPVSAAVGDFYRVTGLQASWEIAQNAGQTIHFGNQSSTTGAGGKVESTNARDVIEIICVVANTDFQVLSSIGNIGVT